jgi:Fur family ferric uptake transcriptional regulator
MICINCGKVIEFSSDKIEKLQEEIAQEYGFNTNDHCLELRGYCKKCAS